MHPSNEILIELLEGVGHEAARAHAAGCEVCHGRLAELHAARTRLLEADVPEPPPLYWSAFRRQVQRRLAEEPVRPRRRHWLALPALAAVAALALVVGPLSRPPGAPPVGETAHLPAWAPLPAVEDDDGWAVLQALASTGALQPVMECSGLAECLGDLSEEEARRVARAFEAELQGGES